jgi:hypothetical protein
MAKKDVKKAIKEAHKQADKAIDDAQEDLGKVFGWLHTSRSFTNAELLVLLVGVIATVATALLL